MGWFEQNSPTSTAPTAGTAPMTGTAPSGGTTQYSADQINQAIQQASQGIDPADPKAVDQLVAKLTAMGIPASSIPSANEATHKLYIAGQAYNGVSSQNFQPGTYKWDPYVQVANQGGFDPKTGAPLNPSSGGGSGGAGGFGSLNFSAPSLEEARNSPGYQFALNQGIGAIQNLAAARGTLLTGGTVKAAQGYATGLADQTYNNRFNQAATTNQIQYGNLYNLAKLGQTSANA